MGILGKIVEFVASDTIADALEVPIQALDKVGKKLEAKNEKGQQEIFNITPGTGILAFSEHRFEWKETFYVYDNNREVKYVVKGDFVSLKRLLRVYDVNGKEIGTIREKLIPLRSPISFESNPVDFSIEINGKKMGKVKSRWALGKQKFEVDYNGWSIVGNITASKFQILNGKEEISQISYKLLNWGGYVATYPDPLNEANILMLVLALIIANAPQKSEKLKRTIHRKSGGWL